METLKELRAKYKQLKKEGDDIYNKIRILEKKEILSNFVVGNCYFDINFNTLIKIVGISNSYIYYIELVSLRKTFVNFALPLTQRKNSYSQLSKRKVRFGMLRRK